VVVLVHHADAVDAAIDAQRPLSEAGRRHALELAEQAAARGVKPAVLWHSGKLRARQTAEPFWRLCNPLSEFSAARGLQPDDPPEWMRDVLIAETREVMIVGHYPYLPRLFAMLTARTGGAGAAFPQHGVVALERVEGGWEERWRLS
jgi:phosphohistidine phosphatase